MDFAKLYRNYRVFGITFGSRVDLITTVHHLFFVLLLAASSPRDNGQNSLYVM